MEEDQDTSNEVIAFEKEYKGHPIHFFAQFQENDWTVITNCHKCEMHMIMPNVEIDEGEGMLFVEAELQMHGVGMTDGWREGLGGFLED